MVNINTGFYFHSVNYMLIKMSMVLKKHHCFTEKSVAFLDKSKSRSNVSVCVACRMKKMFLIT